MATGKQIQRALRKARREAKASAAMQDYTDACEKFEGLTKTGRGGKATGSAAEIAEAKVRILEAIRAYRIATKGKGAPRGKTPPGADRWLT